MKQSAPLGNPSLFLLLTTAIAACGSSGIVLESALDAGSRPPDVDEAGASTKCCPPDKAIGNPMYFGGLTLSDAGCYPSVNNLGCSSNWRIEKELDSLGKVGACDVWRADDRSPRPGENTSCMADPSLDGGCAPGYAYDGDGGCFNASVRRPFLVGSSMRAALARTRGDWSRELAPLDQRPDTATSALLAASWLKDGLEEHASVAAFARFSMLLLSVSAPPDLVASSQRASLDEISHARACFALAQRHGGRAQGPTSLSVHDALGKMSLAEIAALTAEEGCVGETLGAALAAEQLAVATDPQTIAILRKIAMDEARHAELAWRFVAWAAMEGGREVEDAIATAVERAIAGTLAGELRTYDGIDLDMWHAHGRLTCHESRAVTARAIDEVLRPCLATVLRQSRANGAQASPTFAIETHASS